MSFLRMVGRLFLRVLTALGALTFVVAAGVAYARFVEPHWLCIRHLKLSPAPTLRVIHISDIHFNGDTQYLQRVTRTINRLDADLVCFTGDLVETAAFLPGALQILSKINKPLYGVPGNHDRWALRSFESVQKTFRDTGGEWLSRPPVLVPSNHVAVMTLPGRREPTPPGYKRILLEHHPDLAGRIRGDQFNLILSGHTHGGQVRLPFVYRSVIPFPLDTFDRGLFQAPCGPLYVNPGIGTFHLQMRFRCRPEITLIEI